MIEKVMEAPGRWENGAQHLMTAFQISKVPVARSRLQQGRLVKIIINYF